MILEWVARGLIAAAAAAAIGKIIIYISGIITRNKIKEEMRKKSVENALVENINNCTNTVDIKDLESGTEYEIRGDDIDYNIYEGDVIY